MEIQENKANLAKAIIEVMKAIKGIDKTTTIGTGNNAYKGVPDKEVKKVIGEEMAKNGLCILPIETNPRVKVDRWEEVDSYSNTTPKGMKWKQSYFTEVETKYLLLHESGESQILSGYGHGIDTQDKGAGKATTYALKYTLLYTFMVATGKIDDADATHSDEIQTPKNNNLGNTASLENMIVAAKMGLDKATNEETLKNIWNRLNKDLKKEKEIVDYVIKIKTELGII